MFNLKLQQIMKKKLLLTLFTMLLTAGQAWAQWEQQKRVTQVVVWNADQTYTVYKCADQPTINMQDDQMVLTVNDTQVYYPANEVRKFTFDDGSLTPVERTKKQATFDITQERIVVSDLGQGSVNVYDANGRQMAAAKSEGGQATVNISQLRRGVYVVKAGNTNFKFLKR